jgi:hypothetical protein
MGQDVKRDKPDGKPDGDPPTKTTDSFKPAEEPATTPEVFDQEYILEEEQDGRYRIISTNIIPGLPSKR